MRKTAVILMNLGGPDSLESVRPFLFNLFYDKAIIRFSNPLRWIIAKAISSFRFKYSQNIYAQMGGKSPILEETIRQKEALDKLLEQSSSENEFQTFLYMRYWHPMAPEVAAQVREYNPDEIILLPLYPHFSTTTTLSSIEEIEKYLSDFKIKKICCYYDFERFIDSHIENIRKEFDKIQDFSKVILLFSAHSIPEKFVNDGDPYQLQTESSVKEIMKKLNINGLEYKITYQSKVGRMKWLSPSTDQEIIAASKDKKEIYIVPISFVSEHSETLVELDIDYKKLAEENGAAKYFRFSTLSASKQYINSLFQMIQKVVAEKERGFTAIGTECGSKFCGEKSLSCPKLVL
jgi:ferrochelatase